ncbi:carbohydrate kinase [Roseofilum reptotaenium CS-1145]|uniref:Carbohydrate kinase n=1 Tax=Roseofilum reptotaenium AO1-A TaxID=1925591 RepID=A0A1L9QTW9_9CYAN|nr:carbohydrate kinase [Roseofilum reptotaenium]MDB9518454.1 carbohydrate kinase [Roseofilum reptotaenium CS-1145]OJJ26066.1 carbohydrate kinase [Roseofilum reptotaenium AO1-A]
MNTAQVLCLGELLFDCLADKAGLPYDQVKSWTPYPGGAPANVACRLVKLGTPSAFIGSVGSDEAGDSLVNFLQEQQVDIQGIQRHASAPTRQVYVIHSYNGDRYFAGFGETDTTAFADAYLDAALLPIDLFRDAQYLVLGTLELAYPQTQEAIHKALEIANQYHLKLVVDVNWRPVFWPDPEQAKPLIYDLLAQVDFVKVSDREAEFLLDMTDPLAIRDRFPDLEGVVVTGGEKPIHYAIGEGEGSVPAFAVSVKDTIGVGDGFVAGWIHQLNRYQISSLQDPQKVKEIVTYAAAVGALTTVEPGAIAPEPTAKQVQTFLQEQGITTDYLS